MLSMEILHVNVFTRLCRSIFVLVEIEHTHNTHTHSLVQMVFDRRNNLLFPSKWHYPSLASKILLSFTPYLSMCSPYPLHFLSHESVAYVSFALILDGMGTGSGYKVHCIMCNVYGLADDARACQRAPWKLYGISSTRTRCTWHNDKNAAEKRREIKMKWITWERTGKIELKMKMSFIPNSPHFEHRRSGRCHHHHYIIISILHLVHSFVRFTSILHSNGDHRHYNYTDTIATVYGSLCVCHTFTQTNYNIFYRMLRWQNKIT